MSQRLRPRFALALAVMAVTALAAACAPPPPADPVVGDWNITYGNATVVTITDVSGVYNMTAKGPLLVSGGSCSLPSGTLVATFSGTSPNFTGQHGLWNVGSCTFARWTSVAFTLNSNGTLTMKIGGYPAQSLTKV